MPGEEHPHSTVTSALLERRTSTLDLRTIRGSGNPVRLCLSPANKPSQKGSAASRVGSWRLRRTALPMSSTMRARIVSSANPKQLRGRGVIGREADVSPLGIDGVLCITWSFRSGSWGMGGP
jgi:hypothetical protein